MTQVQAPGKRRAEPVTVHVDAVRELARTWLSSSRPGSDRHECGKSLLGVLAAAIEEPPVALGVALSARGGEQR